MEYFPALGGEADGPLLSPLERVGTVGLVPEALVIDSSDGRDSTGVTVTPEPDVEVDTEALPDV